MKLPLHIALRFLRSSLAQTLLIILAIGIGVSVQIFIGSLIQGLQKSLIDKTIGSSSHITVLPEKKDSEIAGFRDLTDRLYAADERILYISPVSDHAALVDTEDGSQSVLVRGFNFTQADRIYGFSEALVSGRLPEASDEALLGAGFLEEYGIETGDKITLVSPDLSTVELTVTGIFDLKVAQINNSWCAVTLGGAESLFSTGGVTALEIQVGPDSVFEADTIAERLLPTVGIGKKINNWKTQNEQLLSGLEGQSISSLMIQIFVMLSVVLGIASILAITVIQKSRQIGILKAMGIKNITASLVFLFEGLILGLLGALTGIALGIGLSAAFTTFALNADGTPVVALFIDPAFMILSGAIAAAACVFASLIPARRSSKLDPIEIIRGN